jgi:RNA polymerase sigma-70 factor (ECF subfamily)
LSDESPNAENKIVKSQITDHVRILLEELPEDQKMVIKMRIYQDMSFKEISENTNVSINTALGRMRYGLINLRKMIDNHNISLIN